MKEICKAVLANAASHRGKAYIPKFAIGARHLVRNDELPVHPNLYADRRTTEGKLVYRSVAVCLRTAPDQHFAMPPGDECRTALV